VCHQENVDRVPKDLPVLIVSGDDDPVGEGGRGVRKLGSMFWKAGIQDLKVKIFEGYRHEILNEIGKEQVYVYLKDWMEARAQK
jgi:alpha-beta hydrolase superfamily lysophospholipase